MIIQAGHVKQSLASALAIGTACAGCSTETPSQVGASTQSVDTTSDTSSAPETGTSTDTSGGEELLCAAGPGTSWCFGVAEVAAGGQPVDLDADGLTDLIGGGPMPGHMKAFHAIGPSNGWYEPLWSLQFDFTFTTIYRVLDVQLDGKSELLVTSGNALDGTISSYGLEGLADPVLLREFDEPRNWLIGRLLSARIDGDDLIDVVLLPEGHNALQVWLGHATLGFVPQPEIELDDDVYSFYKADTADVDGDGAIDLLLADTSLAGPIVYFGDGQGQFPDFARVGDPSVLGSLYARDIDGDARADVMFESASGFVVAFSEDGRSFRPVTYQLGVEPFHDNGEGFSFVPIDLDEDGTIEIFGYHDDITKDEPPDSTFETRMYVFSGATADGFAEESSVVLVEDCSIHSGEGFTPRGPIELDGDGHPDILVAWSGSCPEDFDTTLGVMYRP